MCSKLTMGFSRMTFLLPVYCKLEGQRITTIINIFTSLKCSFIFDCNTLHSKIIKCNARQWLANIVHSPLSCTTSLYPLSINYFVILFVGLGNMNLFNRLWYIFILLWFSLVTKKSSQKSGSILLQCYQQFCKTFQKSFEHIFSFLFFVFFKFLTRQLGLGYNEKMYVCSNQTFRVQILNLSFQLSISIFLTLKTTCLFSFMKTFKNILARSLSVSTIFGSAWLL